MGGKRPGPICTTNVGRDWIDAGTLSRTRSSPSGPLGMALSLVMGGTPVEDAAARRKREADEEASRQRKDDVTLLGYDISVIEESPFGKSDAGRKVVRELKAYLASGNIVYGGTIEGSRADWDGTRIFLDEGYRGKALQTTVELVHEGSHVAWRRAHKKPSGQDAKTKDDVDDEALARKNQLLVYEYLRDTKGWPADEELERRLQKSGGHSGG